MKKFFLSVAVMLAAVSINANAMSDSYILHGPVDELVAEACCHTESLRDLVREIDKLFTEVEQTYPADSPQAIMLFGVKGKGHLAGPVEAITILRTIKAMEDPNFEE